MAINQSYQVNLSVLVKPIWFNKPPSIRIGVNGITENIILEKETWFNYNYVSKPTTNILQIEFYGKTNNDSDMANGKDTAIVIEQVSLNGIINPKFAWTGVYTPDYPLHYLKDNPTAEPVMSPYTYLGWNGNWALEFTAPVFTWIHKVEGLGWIYD